MAWRSHTHAHTHPTQPAVPRHLPLRPSLPPPLQEWILRVFDETSIGLLDALEPDWSVRALRELSALLQGTFEVPEGKTAALQQRGNHPARKARRAGGKTVEHARGGPARRGGVRRAGLAPGRAVPPVKPTAV